MLFGKTLLKHRMVQCKKLFTLLTSCPIIPDQLPLLESNEPYDFELARMTYLKFRSVAKRFKMSIRNPSYKSDSENISDSKFSVAESHDGVVLVYLSFRISLLLLYDCPNRFWGALLFSFPCFDITNGKLF